MGCLKKNITTSFPFFLILQLTKTKKHSTESLNSTVVWTTQKFTDKEKKTTNLEEEDKSF